MSDAHDEAARALREQHQKECTAEMLSIRYLGSNGADSQPRMDKLFDERCAAALRKAYADGAKAEREACIDAMVAASIEVEGQGEDAVVGAMWKAIKARGTGGA